MKEELDINLLERSSIEKETEIKKEGSETGNLYVERNGQLFELLGVEIEWLNNNRQFKICVDKGVLVERK